MKTAIDSVTAGPGATAAMLNSRVQPETLDLWKLTLNGGEVVYWHGGPRDRGPLSTYSFTAAAGLPTRANGAYIAGPLINRGKLVAKLGTEVATVEMKIMAGPQDTINGTPLMPFILGRGFDGATLELFKAYLPTWRSPITGLVVNFAGRVTSIRDVARQSCTVTISSWLVLLGPNMGPDVYQAGCRNQHYDANCTLTPTFQTGVVTLASAGTYFQSNLRSEPDGFYQKGILTFETGANAGLSRAVQYSGQAVGDYSFAFGFPVQPSPGDIFRVARGCLLTMNDCSAQGNLLHFRGEPFTPPAVTGAGF